MDWPSTEKPWLRPIYDHPEFIARNVYRLYGGWWDHNPANMLPAHSEEIAGALVEAVGARPSSSGRGAFGTMATCNWPATWRTSCVRGSRGTARVGAMARASRRARRRRSADGAGGVQGGGAGG